MYVWGSTLISRRVRAKLRQEFQPLPAPDVGRAFPVRELVRDRFVVERNERSLALETGGLCRERVVESGEVLASGDIHASERREMRVLHLHIEEHVAGGA